jgi:hypothetical protein
MITAQQLLSEIGLTVVRHVVGRYPATAEGPSPALRYWATAAFGELQFGAQVRDDRGTIDPRILEDLACFGFLLRPNQRELYFPIPGSDDRALEKAIIAKAAIDAALKTGFAR